MHAIEWIVLVTAIAWAVGNIVQLLTLEDE
jgi:hypothetical protein